MRRVAADLGTGAASLYRYLAHPRGPARPDDRRHRRRVRLPGAVRRLARRPARHRRAGTRDHAAPPVAAAPDHHPPRARPPRPRPARACPGSTRRPPGQHRRQARSLRPAQRGHRAVRPERARRRPRPGSSATPPTCARPRRRAPPAAGRTARRATITPPDRPRRQLPARRTATATSSRGSSAASSPRRHHLPDHQPAVHIRPDEGIPVPPKAPGLTSCPPLPGLRRAERSRPDDRRLDWPQAQIWPERRLLVRSVLAGASH